MATRKNVPASTVRSWFAGLDAEAQKGIPAPGERGRIHADTVAAFRKANPRMDYAQKVAEARTIEVPGVVMLDKAGRKVTRKVTVTTAEARKALGHADGTRGRFNKGMLAEALSAQHAAEVAAQFGKK